MQGAYRELSLSMALLQFWLLPDYRPTAVLNRKHISSQMCSLMPWFKQEKSVMTILELLKLFKYLVSSLGIILQVPTWGIFLYFISISFAGWFRRKEPGVNGFPFTHRFALIIPSHNEENVVGKIISNLKSMQYPTSLYDIFVIADNCTDSTASVARELGAIVLERSDHVKKGKGHSLEWMFNRLFEMQTKYDAVCIFDADNLVSANFLAEMNKHLSMGHRVVQGYLDSKNPHDSWVAANNSIAFWIGNRMFQLPRYYLGLSCVLGGTGMMIATDVLKQIGWGATCLTEDLEFTIKLVLRGMKVYWSHEAVIYDEKPLTMRQSVQQRVRWMQGQADCIVRFFKPLFLQAVRQKDWTALDLSIYLVQPLIVVVNFAFLILGLFFTAVDPRPVTGMGLDITVALFFGLLYINGFFLILERRYSLKTLAYFLTFPLYNLTWVPIVIKGFKDRDRKEWSHTLHIRILDISEIQQSNRA
jgi:cellulose synthase/poly-beta-1,6-N-acetylglucosamine synthase-like glycosyltransferase